MSLGGIFDWSDDQVDVKNSYCLCTVESVSNRGETTLNMKDPIEWVRLVIFTLCPIDGWSFMSSEVAIESTIRNNCTTRQRGTF